MDPSAFAFAIRVIGTGAFIAGVAIVGLIWWGFG